MIIIAKIIAANAAEMGLVNNTLRSPSLMVRLRRRLLSTKSPRIIPKTSGAIGYFNCRRTKPKSPKASMTNMSKGRCVSANGPITQRVKTIGINIFRSIRSTDTNNLVKERPKIVIATVAKNNITEME